MTTNWSPPVYPVGDGAPQNVAGQVRTVGSNYTTFLYRGRAIAYLENIVDSGQEAYSTNGSGFEFVRPLGSTHPQDIVTSRVLDGGTLSLTIRELWGYEVWEHLQGLTGAHSIIDIFARLAALDQAVTCTKLIKRPNGKMYGKTYHGCTVVRIGDGETIELGSLSVAKQLVIAYTHSTPWENSPS